MIEPIPATQPPVVHRVVSWSLSCTHAVKCGCKHLIGSKAYCVICGEDAIVLSREILYRRAGEVW